MIIYLPNVAEQQLIRKVVGGTSSIRWCSSPTLALASLSESNATTLVWDFNPATTRSLLTALERSQAAGQAIRLLVRTDLSRLSSRAVVDIARAGVDARISLKGLDELSADVEALASQSPEPAAEFPIVSELASRRRSASFDIAVGAVMVGRRRVGVRTLSELMGLSVRTLEARLKAERLPVPEALLGWSLSVHTMWRVGVLRWSVKRADIVAGFGTCESLAGYVRRHVGARPAALRRSGDFTELLERFVSLF